MHFLSLRSTSWPSAKLKPKTTNSTAIPFPIRGVDAPCRRKAAGETDEQEVECDEGRREGRKQKQWLSRAARVQPIPNARQKAEVFNYNTSPEKIFLSANSLSLTVGGQLETGGDVTKVLREANSPGRDKENLDLLSGSCQIAGSQRRDRICNWWKAAKHEGKAG